MKGAPLFVTGIARGGTSLVGRMLDAHPRIAVAIDACLPLFRALRGSIVLESEPEFDPSGPMEDSYFDATQRARQSIVLNGRIEVALRGTDLAALREALRRRSSDESADLAPALSAISGGTMRELLDAAMVGIAQTRTAADLARVGFKDLWITELIPALARGYPEARFIVVFRDPRDIVASVLGFLPIDPTQVGHVLSFIRHWRKTVALAYRFAGDAALKSRVMTLRYEDVVTNPDTCARLMCGFLSVAFDRAMIEADRFKDYSAGGVWQGNSTFDVGMNTLSRSPLGRWRHRLAPPIVGLVELACAAEMRACGYEPAGVTAGEGDILEFLLGDDARACSWRSDRHQPVADFGRECARRALLALPRARQPRSEDVADAFLFDDVYAALRGAGTSIVETMA
jgi:hypothetical protein